MLYDYMGAYLKSISVKTYGAHGDGTHDDSNAIIAALQQNGRVYLPNGTYMVSKTINVPNGTSLFGDGDESVIKLSSTFSLDEVYWRNEGHHASMLPIVRTGSDCVLESFKVHGDLSEARDELHVGILVSGNNTRCYGVSTENINYSEQAWADWQEHGSGSYRSGYGPVAYCPGFGLYVFNANNVVVKNGRFINSGYEAVGTEDAKNVVIDGCYCYNTNAVSFQIHRNSKRVSFNNCIADGLNANHGSNFTIHGYPDDAKCEDITISNCILTGVSTYPVHSVWGFDNNVVITGCRIQTTRSGILIHSSKYNADQVIGSSATRYIISNNIIHAGESGNGIVYNGDYCTITGNIVEYGGSIGIDASGEHKEIGGNLVVKMT